MNAATPVSTLAGYTYTLGPAGNRTAVTELGGRTVNYTYDDLYRLTNETIANDTHGINGIVSYGYDAVGNRLSRTSSLAGVPSKNSTYDANDRLTGDTYDATETQKRAAAAHSTMTLKTASSLTRHRLRPASFTMATESAWERLSVQEDKNKKKGALLSTVFGLVSKIR